MPRPLFIPLLRKIYVRLLLVGAFSFPSLSYGQEIEPTQPNQPKVLKLSLKEAVNFVLENNITVKNAKMEFVKADSGELKNLSQYAWTLVGSLSTTKTTLPNNNNNFFTGQKIANDRATVGIQKQFQTQTYFSLELSHTRFDSNAFESQASAARLGALGPLLAAPPQYTDALTFTLSQELLKYSFGRTEKNRQKVLKQNVVIQKDQLVDILSQLVVKTLVDYWTLSIYDSQVETFEKLERNTRSIRDLTTRKRNLGLSESFEVNQWNSALTQTQNSLERAKLSRSEAERNLVRVLNVDPSSKVAGITDLQDKVPTDINPEKDYQYALANRIDLKNLVRQREIADLELRIKESEDMPSLKITGSYSTRGQTFLNPQTNYVNPETGMMSFKYPEKTFGFALSYPLFDTGIQTDIRDAKLKKELLEKQETELKLTIREELENRYTAIVAGQDLLETALRRRDEAEKFYRGVQQRFNQGRFTAVIVKSALDNLIQSELMVAQARINFNVDIIRYDLARNYVFEKFGVNVKQIVDELSKFDLEKAEEK
ncbi:TolC family protein [Leptospira wolffii]|uniref:Channel protein TolC n=1 Tax=Leptospira wolffii TaxID=409998 RepID=A0A2M9ZA73_9LEPT|nr:TolC family protein [Leptospira wolffii]PJZ65325.1 channel protein TolC [Leptospira wolffii]TGK64796.1 TolC family protein [Leptospira wolffii]TGK76805.1 TolC family protein [Leptospira wolffii]TGK77343.1 TolC family protein [Leptospira wolffii]TGL26738.1 TolC family protein [Leptospira wolffii]